MQTTKPSSNKKTIILIASGAIVLLCIACLAIGLIYGQTPTYKATSTARVLAAATEKAKPTNTMEPSSTPKPTNTSAPTNTPKATDTLVPTNTPKATDTPAPTNTPVPTDTPAPTDTPTQPPQPVSYEGTGDQVVDVNIPFEVSVAEFEYTGGRNFIVESYDENNNQIDLLVNTIGSYKGRRPVDFKVGQKTVRLQIQSSGPWKVTFFPISVAYLKTCEVPGHCEGTGDDVILLTGSNSDTGKFTHSGQRNFIVIGYSGRINLLINEIGAYDGTVMMSSGTKILEIEADGNWTIDTTAR